MSTGNRAAPGLIRALGLWSAIAVVVGSMIGQSIFLVASDMARELGSVTGVLAAWVIGGVAVLFGAFCYGELFAELKQRNGYKVAISYALLAWIGDAISKKKLTRSCGQRALL